MSAPRSLPEDVSLDIATPGDVPELLALWAVAAENDGRPGDTAQAVLTLGATRLDAMVLEGNELGQALWHAAGYSPQAQWRRWTKPAAVPPAL